MDEKRHKNFYNTKAKNNFELGLLMGEKFGNFARATIAESKEERDWTTKIERAKQYLNVTEQYFPHYVEELQGYAKGANVEFLDLWTMSLEEDVHQELNDKCTTIITNDGKLISHNEDWDKDSEDSICLLLKTIGDVRIFEIFYFNTLGGNSISINSHGFITSVNTLVQSDKKFGIPRNVIARWLSETKNPDEDSLRLKSMPRSLGFNFNVLNKEGKIWNIEYNSAGAILTKPNSPYVHTNHYLSELKSYEMNDNSSGTFDRYEVANSKVKTQMTISELTDLTNDTSRGAIRSIMKETTIAKTIVDLEKARAYVWLRRENDKGWLEYNLSELLNW